MPDANLVYSKGLPYYSQAMIVGSISGSTLSVPAGSVLAFNYAVGDPLIPAGFPTSWGNASYAQTNLQQARSTNGDDFIIRGIQVKFTSDSEAKILENIYDDSDVTLETEGGTRVVHLGPLSGIPGGNGIQGAMHSYLRPGINSREGLVSFATSGIPKGGPDAMLKIPNGFRWLKGNSAASQLLARITTTKAFTVSIPAARTVSATGDEYTPPAAVGDRGTYVRLSLRLIGESV